MISNNSAGSSGGAGLAYGANGEASPEGLTITNTTFSSNTNANTATADEDGGALSLFGTPTSTFSVTNSRFVSNTTTSSAGSGPAVGGAIWQESGNLTVTGSTFSGNTVSGPSTDTGGAVEVTSGTSSFHYDRFVGNSAPTGSAIHTLVAVNATENWWGCQAGPGGAGCDTVSGTATVAPRLVLTASASLATVVGPSRRHS